jgi:hypothetical protein
MTIRKKKSGLLSLLLAVIGLAGAVAQDAAATTNAASGDVYIGIISFDQTVRDLTDGKPVLLNEAGYNRLIGLIDNQYQKASAADQGTSLYYAVHNAFANLTANTEMYPENLVSVSVLTFTDGLDNNSTSPNLKALEGQSFAGRRLTEYQSYLQAELAQRNILEKPITAYSVGIQGKDVFDNAQFRTSINSLASSDKSAFFLENFDELGKVFNDIAESLYKETEDITFNMVAPFYPTGTRLRMTFDVPLGNNSPDAAAASKDFLEGEVNYTDEGGYQLMGVTYKGSIISTAGAYVPGVLGRLITYTFGGFQGFNLKDKDASSKLIQQWSMAEGSSVWQVNSEYAHDIDTATNIETKSTVIYLVLDSSNSLDENGVRDIRSSVKDFLKIMYTGIPVAPVEPAPVPSVVAKAEPVPAPAPTPAPTPAPAPVVVAPPAPKPEPVPAPAPVYVAPPAPVSVPKPAPPPEPEPEPPEVIRPADRPTISMGSRVGAMFLNSIFGLGSLSMGDDGGWAIYVMDLVSYPLVIIPLAIEDDPWENVFFIIGVPILAVSFIFSIVLPAVYEPPVRRASANPLNGLNIGLGAGRKGNIDKVSLTYTYTFRH